MKVKIAIAAVALTVAATICMLAVLSSKEPDVPAENPAVGTEKVRSAAVRPEEKPSASRPAAERDARSPGASDKKETDVAVKAEPAPEMTDDEKTAAEDEKRVDEFDAMVDKWMEPSRGKAVSMADVDAFREQFRKVPKARKEECVHRALNLIPDDNVMLLAGILFDKAQDKEILDLVYNDILNRDEAVKKPILKELFKDKEHPNWADTAWILDVTGELPANGQGR